MCRLRRPSPPREKPSGPFSCLPNPPSASVAFCPYGERLPKLIKLKCSLRATFSSNIFPIPSEQSSGETPQLQHEYQCGLLFLSGITMKAEQRAETTLTFKKPGLVRKHEGRGYIRNFPQSSKSKWSEVRDRSVERRGCASLQSNEGQWL